jgi:hypothetical protein
MYLPNAEIQSLIYASQKDLELLGRLKYVDKLNKGGDFLEVHWLNTPGPIYTTYTDNTGTGRNFAINNVSVDENWQEAIFRQPVNLVEMQEVIIAATTDPFEAYFFDGNLNWNQDSILSWWDKSWVRISYIIELYKKELELPIQEDITAWMRPMPENFKAWLDFYQLGMKDYLEWYVYKIENKQIINLPPLKFDWTIKEELDIVFKIKLLNKG